MVALATATRKVRNPLRPVGITPGLKCETSAVWESACERDAQLDAEFDPRVVKYIVQPERLTGWLGGVLFHYTPDMRVTLDTGEIVRREVKSSPADVDDFLQAKLQVIDANLRAEGSRLELVFASELRRGSRMDNIRLLFRYARMHKSAASERQILQLIHDRSTVGLGYLWTVLPQSALPTLYRMLFEQVLSADLEACPIGRKTKIWRSQ